MNSCRILAHRGASLEAPENTRAAFDRAFQLGADGFETDVQLSRDAVPMLWHDRFLNKLGLQDRRVDDSDFEELSALRFDANNAATGLLGLADCMQAYRKRGVLNLEVKFHEGETERHRRLKMRRILNIVETATPDDLFVSSSDAEMLSYAFRYTPDVPLFQLFDDDRIALDIVRVLNERPFLAGCCLPVSQLEGQRIDLLHARGKLVAVYTCNTPDEIETAFALGVDMLITDNPGLASRLCR